ncbi:putative DNA topoisomerase I protein [Pseudorhizobium banfieldiae]|uniref:DNA topoisomerase n=1 Tax=Pseudorhizobium banfieldiae TaxID=1125847 RepID=L0NHS8_9HYPH|nr:DNA topoisomerase IB [Pseudorhizobium banfieldiae]CAD6616983.1 DNA topoisomerase [arsenite-oxidising bacterium NT-25]CCF20648.1 putative DNA topoisomerase I protein [Pseudorhizobium banfieldiae]
MDAITDLPTFDEQSLKAAGLTYVSDVEPGIRRERRGKGFCYRLPDGSVLSDPEEKRRIVALGLPPAYENVWICMDRRGHLQATGYDARGRKQYRYHPEWQSLRSELKFDQLARFGEVLPRIRRRIERDLALGLDTPEAVLAAIIALMDTAHLRVGNQAYAKENRTYGATTLLKRHMTLTEEAVVLRFTAKGGKRVSHTIKHPRLQRIFEEIADLPGRQLFSWPDDGGTAHPVDSGRLNAYLADVAGFPVSAKTFRTWGGSLAGFAAVWQACKEGSQPRVKLICKAASERLHNTPAVCRSSYIHPAVLALVDDASPVERLLKNELELPQLRGLRADERRLLAVLKSSSLQTQTGAAADPLQRWRAAAAEA